jgi:hypothetical protein
MTGKRVSQTVSCALASLALLCLCWVASAGADAPGWQVIGRAVPTYLPPGGQSELRLQFYDLGAVNASAGAVVSDTLPEGLTVAGFGAGTYPLAGATCSGVGSRTFTCEFLDGVEAGHSVLLPVKVAVAANATTGLVMDPVTISGGGALGPTNVSVPLTISSGRPPAGFSTLAAWATTPDGTIDTQAGSHPYDLMVAFGINEIVKGEFQGVPSEFPSGGQARTINVNLPPGLIGDPQAVPQCPRAKFIEGASYSQGCPVDTMIGENRSSVGGLEVGKSPVFNLVPPPGVAAQFAFIQSGITVFIDSGVRTGGDNGVTSHVRDIPERDITFNTTNIWGTPGDPRHDEERCFALAGITQNCTERPPPVPFLTMPTSCGTPPEFSAEELGTWEHEKVVLPPARYLAQDNEGKPTGLTGCERLQPFGPEISIAPDTSYADTPAGLSVDVKMPQGANTEGLQTPGLKGTTVVLPTGIGINPGQATGLQACQPSQEAIGTEPSGEVDEGPVSCPSASKVGTVEISSPLLRDKLQGNVYILSPNPPNLQLLIAASGDGVNLKLVGTVHLDETTGQLTTTFDETPDVPFTDFKLNFSSGAQAALATPTACGTYESNIDFTPWSTPFIEDALDTSRFGITAGPGGSPCVSPMPFSPSMIAGATTDQAGGFTDFTMLLQRGDEQQRIKSLSFKTPEGLLGMIAKVPLCQEPQAAQGTCSSASQIGHTVVGAGPGPFPFYIPQASAPPAPIYLTGPYRGAPFGLSIVVPLIAGPFNLGTEVVRGRIEVDPLTSQITVTTDPLPQIEKGIPADLRLINAVIDRPEFMFNPTSCAPMSFSGTATSTEGASATLSSHFQMGSCQALKFKPDFKVSTSGKTSRKNGASLDVKLVYPTGALGANQASSQSNIQKVKVDLPKQLPSRLTTLQKACTAATFEANPAACPVESRVGTVTAITPVLPVPLTGPAVFVSYGGAKFPELVFVLQGYGVTVYVHAETFISKAGITSSTLRKVPDVPIASFELKLPQGPFSALAANGNLCKSKLSMPTAFTAQNEAVLHQNTPITVTGCPKAKKARKAGRHHKGTTHKKKK